MARAKASRSAQLEKCGSFCAWLEKNWAKNVPQQIELIEKLEARGFTYRLTDGIYFDTARDPNYGQLSGLCASREHARVSLARDKRSPADFALWKLCAADAPPRQMKWPSPWGVGFPGWHIECSVMATHYLGTQFDIHTGGVDHVAVHHTNEIAQAEQGLGVRPWVRFWLHGAWLLGSGEKLSKSAGNAPSLDDLEHLQIEPEAFRYYLLTAHYRAPLNLNLQALEAAQVAWTRLSRFALSDARDAEPDPLDAGLVESFGSALATDLDAPRALAVIWQAVHARWLPPTVRRAHVRSFARALGLTLRTSQRHAERDDPDQDGIEDLVRERERARARRDFGAADSARRELAARGVTVVDMPEGPRGTRR